MAKTENTATPGKRVQQKEARRVAIIEAALEEFTSQGFTATKLEDVAVRAGIGKGTIYLYFNSKEELFEEVVRRTLLPEHRLPDNFVADYEGTTEELLTNHFRFMYSFMQHEKVPPVIAMVLGELVRFPHLSQFFYDEMISHSQAMLQSIIARGIKSGEFRACAINMHHQLLISPALLGVIWNLQFKEQAPLDLAVYSEMHIDFILRALRA
ncbi:MAG: TetR/AcrR family transcriptional regulator [Pseudomonadota bacterium]